MAHNIYHEARGESFEGQVAVANVVMNRVALQGWMGKDITDVLTKPYQFSWLNGSDWTKIDLSDIDDAYVTIARNVINGNLGDVTDGATHYYSTSILKEPPNWATSMENTVTIDNHRFYR